LEAKKALKLWVVGAVLLAVCIAGHSLTTSPALAAKKVEVNVTAYSWMYSLNPNLWELAEEYNRQNPDIYVKLTRSPTEGFDVTRFKLEAARKRSTWDAWMGITPFIDFYPLVTAGVLDPWDEYIPGDILRDVFPVSVEESTYQGKLYSWPIMISVTGINYRPGMLKMAGYEKPPETWNELLQASAKIMGALKAPDGKPVYGIVMDQRAWWRYFVPVGFSFSKDILDSEGVVNWDSPAVVETLEMMKKIVQYSPPDIYAPGGDMEVFKAGKAAMLIKYVDAGMTAAKVFGLGDFAFAALPAAGPGKHNGTAEWTTGASLFKYGEYKKEAADFMAYLIKNEQFQRGWIDSAEPPAYVSWSEKWKDVGWLVSNRKQMDRARYIPPMRYFGALIQVWRPAQERFLKGEISAQQMLMEARKAYEEAIKKM